MSKSTPSLLALLGLVAVAGYQNRGRISEMLADARQGSASTDQSPKDDTSGGGFLSEISQLFQSGPGATSRAGGTIAGALTEVVNRFKGAGQGAAADSWVSDSPNAPLDVKDLEAALGEDTLTDLSARTGLSRAELLLRLNTALPEVVNRMTPKGRIPFDDEADEYS